MMEEFFNYKGEVTRPDTMIDIPPARVMTIGQAMQSAPEGWTPEDGYEDLAIPPQLKEYYDEFLEQGQNRFADDVRTMQVQIPSWIANHEIYDDHFALSNAYFGAWSDNATWPPEPTEPPEISDYRYTENGQTIDLRDVNAERESRDAALTFKSPEHASELIKKIAHLYGATLVGITTMNADYAYKSIRGMGGGGGLADAGVHSTDGEADAAGAALPEEALEAVTAALDDAGLDSEVIVGILQETVGQEAMMNAFGDAGIDPTEVMSALEAAGIDFMALLSGEGSDDISSTMAAMSGAGAGVASGGMQDEPHEIPEHWKYCIVLGIPHEWDQFVSNPQYGDSLDAYARARMAAYRLSEFLKRIGYAARMQAPPGSYDMVVTPFALQAGLGQWGRNACVITPELGCNVRLAVVTTDLEMAIDNPIDIGVHDFCKDCKICAELCPSNSISFADSPEGMTERGIEHWYINNSTCYGYWMESMGPIGCRLCLAVCPYSRKDNWTHGFARLLDPVDPTGLLNDTLIWLQRTLFDAPEASAYRRPPDGCFASYRPAPEWLQGEKWFTYSPPDPHDEC